MLQSHRQRPGGIAVRKCFRTLFDVKQNLRYLNFLTSHLRVHTILPTQRDSLCDRASECMPHSMLQHVSVTTSATE